MNEEYQEYLTQERLKNKAIEPDNKSSRFANRNLQLGKIHRSLLPFVFHRLDRIIKYDKIPEEYGGFLTKDFSDMENETVNLQFIASGSQDGFVREIIATERKLNDNRYTEVKMGRFGRMVKKE